MVIFILKCQFAIFILNFCISVHNAYHSFGNFAIFAFSTNDGVNVTFQWPTLCSAQRRAGSLQYVDVLASHGVRRRLPGWQHASAGVEVGFDSFRRHTYMLCRALLCTCVEPRTVISFMVTETTGVYPLWRGIDMITFTQFAEFAWHAWHSLVLGMYGQNIGIDYGNITKQWCMYCYFLLSFGNVWSKQYFIWGSYKL